MSEVMLLIFRCLYFFFVQIFLTRLFEYIARSVEIIQIIRDFYC